MYYLIAIIAIFLFSIYSFISNKAKRDKRFYESLKTKRKNKNKLNLELVQDLYIYSKDEMSCRSRIDDNTWNDLEMDKLFNDMDNNITSIGSEYLYRELHYIDKDNKSLDSRLGLYNLFLDEKHRERISYILNSVGKSDYNGLSVFMKSDHKMLEFSKLLLLLRFLPILTIPIIFINRSEGIVLLILSIVINFVTNYYLRYKIKADISAINYLSNIVIAAKKLVRIESDNEVFNNYQMELKKLVKDYAKIRIQILNSDIDFTSIVGVLIEYYKAMTLSDVVYYNEIMNAVINKKDITNRIIDKVAELDMCFAVSAYKNCFNAVSRYDFSDDKEMDFDKLYHPLVSDPVKNTRLDFSSAIITGSNATGKSTFIKAIAISAIFSQSLGFAFADSFRLRRSLVISSMAIRDDISSNESYFIKEIKSLKRIVDSVESNNCIVLVDEILRGTNTIERISASESVLRYLSQFDSLVIAATHDIELAYLLDGAYKNYHFKESYDKGEIVFDYLLWEGPSKTRNAIKLLESMGFNEEIVTNARNNASKYVNS